MSTVNNLKPKSSGTQTLDYVWAYDSGAHIVGLSGETLPTVAKLVNANDPKNKLTQALDSEGEKIIGLWTDEFGKFYKNDISGGDISGALFSKAFYVSNGNGTVRLTNLPVNSNKYTFPMGELVNTLYTDQADTPYLTSYKRNVPLAFQNTETDLSLTIVPGTYNNPDDVSTTHFNPAWLDNSNNKITIDCSGFIYGTDASFNPVNVDLSLNLYTGYFMNSYAGARANTQTRLYVNMHKMGVGPISSPNIKYSSTSVQNTFIDISVNVLNAGSKLVIVTDGSSVINAQQATLQPNIDLMNVLTATFDVDGTYTFTKAGRQNLRIPITIGAGVFGQWFWKINIKDGNMESTIRQFNLKVMPSFSEPVSTVTGETTLYDNDSYKVNLKVANNNFNSDICNNLTRGLMLRPRLNAVGSNLIDLDISAVNINNAITLNYSTSANVYSTRTLDMYDLSKNTLDFADISNSFISVSGKGLVVRAQDISNNGTTDFKLNDVSTNINITSIGAQEYRLPSRSFNMYVDWLPNAQPDVSLVMVPQTLSIGTFNIGTAYSSNVIIVNNNNGTFSLSLSDYDGDLSSANYRIKVFTDKKCSTLATSNVTLETQTNIDKSSNGLSATDFKVSFDSENNATFIAPKLEKNTNNSTYYMVAYLEKTNVFLYTASNIVSFTNFNFPTILLSFDNIQALTAANLNKIVNIDNNLDLDVALADLSGYAVKSISEGFDLSCNLSLPEWKINKPTLTFTLNDTNNVVKSFDISTNNSRPRSVGNKIVFDNVKDVSHNRNFFIDLSYNNSTEQCLFSMNVAFSDEDNNDYSKTNKTVVFYYNGNYTAPTSNVGNNKRTLIVYNDTKYIIDNKPELTQMALGQQDSFETYSWLAGSASNSYVLNLARTEFVGSGQTLDVSGFRISTTTRASNSVDASANLYIGYSGPWTEINTSFVTDANNVLPVAAATTWVTPSFARNNFSWLDMKKFVGTIDISYKTKHANGISVTPNTLRLVVVPRPNVTLSISQFPNVLVNTKSVNIATITNASLNKAGGAITLDGWAPTDASGNKSLATKLRTIMSINSGSLRLVQLLGAPDVTNASSFVIPSIGDLAYGKVAMPVITFNGRSIAGLVSSNLRATYSAFGSRPVSSLVTPFSVAVYSTDSTFNNNVYTNNLYANNSINFAGMPFVQYVTLDNSNNTIALHTDTRTKNAAFVVVENKGSVTSASITANTLTGTATVTIGGINVYQHTSGTTWTFLYSKQN
jgi:hypothetical protein